MAGWNNSYTDSAKPELPEAPIQVREREYKHSIVRTEDLQANAIISHIEGSSWVTDYYAQVLGMDQEPVPYDINQSSLNQQYHLIQNLELKLQDQTTDTDETTNRLGVTGTAVIYAGIIPNVGDVIISDIGGSLAGRHSVTRVTKKMYLKDTVYEIDFELVEYLNTKDKENHLNSFVIKTSIYDRDLITYGSSPLILKDDYDDYLKAEDIISELIDDYLKEFYSNELTTLEVPGYGIRKTYDPYAVEAFKEVVLLDEHPLMYRLKTLNVNEIKEAYSFSIWPVLLDPAINKIRNIWTKAGPVSHDRFHLNFSLNSFRYSGFAQCISPVQDLQNVDYYHGWAQQPKVGSLMTLSRMTSILAGGYGSAIGEQLAREVNNSNKLCCHHLVHYHDANPRAIPENSKTWMDTVNLWVRANANLHYCDICGGCHICCECHKPEEERCDAKSLDYVLCPDFFEGNAIDDDFHALVRSYLRGDHIELKPIFKLVNARQSLTPKKRFYNMLVLLIILKSTMRGL